MKITTAIILISLLFLGCIMPNKNMNFDSMKVIKYILDDKIISEDTLTNRSEYKIAYNVGAILYEVQSIHLKEFGDTVDNGKFIKKFIPSDTTYSYYVIKDGDEKGLNYDSLGINTPNIFKRDSLLKMLNLDEASLRVYSVDLGKPLSVEKQQHIEIETYGKLWVTDPDSIYRYYDSSLKDLPFSFAPLLDKKKGKKLTKTVYIYLRSQGKNKEVKPRIEAETRIEEIKTNKPKEFISLFQRFEKDRALFELK